MHFLGQAFPTEKSQVLSVFSIKKKPSALKNIQNFKICKNPRVKTAKFQMFKNAKLLTLFLEYTALDVVMYQVLRLSEQLRLPKVSETLCPTPTPLQCVCYYQW